jgi:4-amino-4-deoxy-L-arabinose transferase-like glycosyltransferase
VVLTATSAGYGYHRDELYFRMLPLQWGYVDQPPLTPLLVRAMSGLVDQVWAVRVPATVFAVVTVLLVALVARELGGDRLAQGLAAWGYAFAAFPLAFGHVLFTSGLDGLMWVASTLCVVRAVGVIRPPQPRWWVAAGAVVGAATANKLLVALLVVALGVGLAVVGPRRLPWRWTLAGAGVAAVLAAPALLYQATHAWPQLAMGQRLSAKNGPENRALMLPFLLLLLGPLLVPVWVTGLLALWRRPAWRRGRFLAVAFVVLLALSFAAAGQVYYPLGLLAVVYAAGCVPVAEWMRRVGWRRRLVVGAVLVNSVVAAVISLPLVPVTLVGSTPVPAINQSARDQVGWPEYAAQVASVYAALPDAEKAGAVLVTTNYGEAGALARYGPAWGLPTPMSGQNELYLQARPPDTRAVAVVVGRGAEAVAARNATCTVATTLDNGVGVANEEQRQPVAVCRAARLPWAQVWPSFQHLD